MGVGQRRQDLRRAGARAQAAHAGIDLEVVANGLAGGGGETVHVADLRQGVDDRSEIEFDQGFGFVGQKAAHHQNARVVDAAAAQLDALVDGTDGQPTWRPRHRGRGRLRARRARRHRP